MPRSLTIQQIIGRWQRGAEQNGPTNYEEGVRATTDNPMEAAAAASDYWLKRVTESKDKFVRNLSGKPIDNWKTPALGKGKNRFAEGVRAGVPKATAFWTKFKPALDAATATVRAMPKMSESDRDRRAAKMAELLRAYGKGGGA